MKHIVSIGGGISSTLALPLWAVSKFGKQNVDLVMARLPNEDADVWRLCEAVEDIVGIPITYIGENQTPWDIFFKHRNIHAVVNNVRTDPCSYHAKRMVMKNYVLENYAPNEATMYVGIGRYELDRELSIRKAWGERGYKVGMPFIDFPEMNRDWFIRFCRNTVGFVPKLYDLDFDHNNCGGACIKAGHKQWAKLWWYSRQGVLKTHEGIPTFNWWRDNEQRFRADVSPKVAILRDWRGKGKPLSLVEFERRLEARVGKFLPGFGALMMGWQEFESSLDDLDETPGCSFCDAAA